MNYNIRSKILNNLPLIGGQKLIPQLNLGKRNVISRTCFKIIMQIISIELFLYNLSIIFEPRVPAPPVINIFILYLF